MFVFGYEMLQTKSFFKNAFASTYCTNSFSTVPTDILVLVHILGLISLCMIAAMLVWFNLPTGLTLQMHNSVVYAVFWSLLGVRFPHRRRCVLYLV